MVDWSRFLKDLFTSNLSYKGVSLLVALVLWVTILGRRDYTISKTLDIEIVTNREQVLLSQSHDSVRVKFTGPKTAIRKLSEPGVSPVVLVELDSQFLGEASLKLDLEKLELPLGVEVLSFRPEAIIVKVAKKESYER